MDTKLYSPSKRDEILEDWQRAVDQLLQQIASWVAEEPGWRVEPHVKEITEEALGTYHINALTIHTPEGRLHLEPVARIVLGGRGTVELYIWPTLYRVRLLRGKTENDWRVLTDSGITLRQEWNKENFITLAKDLLNAS